MSHFDAEVADIVVVLDKSCDGKVNEMALLLTSAGLQVDTTDLDMGLVEGTIETSKLADLQKLPCVNYIRTVLTYMADYPVGDPRDKDLAGDDDTEDADTDDAA